MSNERRNDEVEAAFSIVPEDERDVTANGVERRTKWEAEERGRAQGDDAARRVLPAVVGRVGGTNAAARVAAPASARATRPRRGATRCRRRCVCCMLVRRVVMRALDDRRIRSRIDVSLFAP